MDRVESHLGAVPLGKSRCAFRVWAPSADSVEVHLLSPEERMEPLARDRRGYHRTVLEGVQPGDLYLFRLTPGKERPDPASRFQPQGVHGPSQVVDPDFDWTDGNWRGIPLHRYIIYELHVGTFTASGSFDAAIERLDDLAALGITAIELMPVAQFPGERNWGYDGTYPFAAQNSYGGPQGLKHFVDACHARGLAVVLDVVYNHLGPEGNYLRDFGPYFSDSYQTPWGQPINFDGPYSNEVRRYFIENALYWTIDCHIDALRLDAVHAILDFSARPFLQELADAIKFFADHAGRHIHLIAESALNDTRLIRPPELGGFGLDAQWNDDLHHALHAVLTGERQGYYCDFGSFDQLIKALRDGFVYDGQYSEYRKRNHGNSSRSICGHRFVAFSQNHDQIGNRMKGDRLSCIVPLEALKMAAGVILLSPNLPLLFMGEEYGEMSPFPYFVCHSDPDLIAAVRRGRSEEFASFGWEGEPPDPLAEETFNSAKLKPEQRCLPGVHQYLWEFYRHLIAFRRNCHFFTSSAYSHREIFRIGRLPIACIRFTGPVENFCILFHAGRSPVSVSIPLPAGRWEKALDSSEARWGGSGTALSNAINSDGEVILSLSPYAFLVLSKQIC